MVQAFDHTMKDLEPIKKGPLSCESRYCSVDAHVIATFTRRYGLVVTRKLCEPHAIKLSNSLFDAKFKKITLQDVIGTTPPKKAKKK